MIVFMGLNEKQLSEAVSLWEQHTKMPIKRIMTRAEAVILLRDNVFGLTDTGQAMKWVDFFIATGMLEIKEEENKPIFEINGPPFTHIKIWANGKVEGCQGTVINRIPQYLMKDDNKETQSITKIISTLFNDGKFASLTPDQLEGRLDFEGYKIVPK